MHATRKVKPTTKTITLFDGTRRIRSPHFGRGVLADRPTHAAPASHADMEWLAAQVFATDTFALGGEIDPDEAGEPDWDSLFLESAMVDRICRGHVL